jgi:hypothetical protein
MNRERMLVKAARRTDTRDMVSRLWRATSRRGMLLVVIMIDELR